MAAGLAAVGLLSPGMAVSSATAAPAVRIYRVWYDSPGKDTRSNASLNGEWVQIKNQTRSSRSLRGWSLRDRSGHVYVFGAYTLRPGKTVKIHTGRGKNTASQRYQGKRTYVWDNRDSVSLRTAAGRVADTCSWSKGRSKYCLGLRVGREQFGVTEASHRLSVDGPGDPAGTLPVHAEL